MLWFLKECHESDFHHEFAHSIVMNEMSTQRLRYVMEFRVCTMFISWTPRHHSAYHTERRIHEGVGYQLGGLLLSLHPWWRSFAWSWSTDQGRSSPQAAHLWSPDEFTTVLRDIPTCAAQSLRNGEVTQR